MLQSKLHVPQMPMSGRVCMSSQRAPLFAAGRAYLNPGGGRGPARRPNGIPAPASGALESSDVVSLPVPLIDSTRHLIDTRTAVAQPDHAILVNTSRGRITHDEAVVRAALAGPP